MDGQDIPSQNNNASAVNDIRGNPAGSSAGGSADAGDLNDREAFGGTANSNHLLGGGLGNIEEEQELEESPLRGLVSEIESRYR